jgi:hypothetical protein
MKMCKCLVLHPVHVPIILPSIVLLISLVNLPLLSKNKLMLCNSLLYTTHLPTPLPLIRPILTHLFLTNSYLTIKGNQTPLQQRLMYSSNSSTHSIRHLTSHNSIRNLNRPTVRQFSKMLPNREKGKTIPSTLMGLGMVMLSSTFLKGAPTT